ncbi:MAG: hypothetical protein KAI26_07375, partial [Nanoarchaeota archaeon]|nr:hypothetical protein [Nanoarchaeota archaeon]
MSQNQTSLESSVKKSYSSLNSKQKSRILDRIERERRRVLVNKLYIKGFKNDNDKIKKGTASSLDSLSLFNPELASELYINALSEKSNLSDDAGNSLKGCNHKFLSDLFSKLINYNNDSKDKDNKLKKNYLSFCKGAFQYFIINKPESAKKGFDLTFTDSTLLPNTHPPLSDLEIRNNITNDFKKTYNLNSKHTKALICKMITSKEYVPSNNFSRFMPDFNSNDFDLAKKSLSRIIELIQRDGELGNVLYTLSTFQPLYLEKLFKYATDPENYLTLRNIKESFLMHLDLLINVNPNLAFKYFEDTMTNINLYAKRCVAESLGFFSNVYPDKTMKHYKKGLKNESDDIKKIIASQ